MLTDLLATLKDAAHETRWMSAGRCAEVDPELFFAPDHAFDGWDLDAKLICASCPQRLICLRYALDRGLQHGVWGGTSPADRDVIQAWASAQHPIAEGEAA